MNNFCASEHTYFYKITVYGLKHEYLFLLILFGRLVSIVFYSSSFTKVSTVDGFPLPFVHTAYRMASARDDLTCRNANAGYSDVLLAYYSYHDKIIKDSLQI